MTNNFNLSESLEFFSKEIEILVKKTHTTTYELTNNASNELEIVFKLTNMFSGEVTTFTITEDVLQLNDSTGGGAACGIVDQLKLKTTPTKEHNKWLQEAKKADKAMRAARLAEKKATAKGNKRIGVIA